MPARKRRSELQNVAILDPHAFDRAVMELLDEKLAEIEALPRYRDQSYVDDDGVHHARGGVWNDRTGRAAEGYSKADVEDIRGSLHELGLTMSFEDADAMMSEYFRSGALRLSLQLQNEPPPRTKSPIVEVEELGRERYRVGNEVVSFNGRRARCTCRPDRCEHEVVVRARRSSWDPKIEAFAVKDASKGMIVARIVHALKSLPDVEARHNGRRPFSPKQRLVALVIARLFADEELKEAANAAVIAGFMPRFPTRSIWTFKKDEVTLELAARAYQRIGNRPKMRPTDDPVKALIAVASRLRSDIRATTVA